jgi:hypothetical protein
MANKSEYMELVSKVGYLKADEIVEAYDERVAVIKADYESSVRVARIKELEALELKNKVTKENVRVIKLIRKYKAEKALSKTEQLVMDIIVSAGVDAVVSSADVQVSMVKALTDSNSTIEWKKGLARHVLAKLLKKGLIVKVAKGEYKLNN